MSQYRNKKTINKDIPPSSSLPCDSKAIQSNSELVPLRNSAPSLLASAVLDLFPDVVLAGGGITDIGFYYDFIFSQPLHADTLSHIEVKLKSHAKQDSEIRSISMMRENAQQLFLHHHQPILAELAGLRSENIIPLLQIGTCYDLSPTPHITSTLELKNIKLLAINEETKTEGLDSPLSVIRISGTVFQDPITLKTFCKAYEFRKKNHHCQWGKELNLFHVTHEGTFWHPKGETLRQILLTPWHQENKKNFSHSVSTPISSHSIFSEHIRLYKNIQSEALHSPLQLSECRPLVQASPVAEGLFVSKSYLSDQTSIFCRQTQILSELISSLHLIEQSLIILGFEYYRYVSPFGQGKWLIQALNELNLSYSTTQEKTSSVEWRIVDSLGREWKGPSIHLQGLGSGIFAIGRSLFESVDRTVGLLLEKHQGQLPFELTPEQIRVVSVGDAELAYAETIVNECRKQGFRVEWDSREEKLGAKIHSAEKEKIPYILIIGDKERNQKRISVRYFEQKHKIQTLFLEEFLSDLKKQLKPEFWV